MITAQSTKTLLITLALPLLMIQGCSEKQGVDVKASDASPTVTDNCANIKTLAPKGVTITSAEQVTGNPDAVEPFNARTHLYAYQQIDVPHCKVSGVIGEENNFELILPDDWNGRFVMGGGGGYVGMVLNAAKVYANDGYATVGTDTGHQAPPEQNALTDWAFKNHERKINFGYQAVHDTATVAKQLIDSYYGKAAEYSYFLGCSTGGRQALMEAQRFPNDFDGIVSGSPAIEPTAAAARRVSDAQYLFPNPDDLTQTVVTTENLALLSNAVMKACDALDGVADQVIDDPAQCDFDLNSIASCTDNEPGAECLTQQQRQAIAKIYAPLTDETGTVYPGMPYGTEVTPSWQLGWQRLTAFDADLLEAQGYANGGISSAEFFKNFVYDNPEWHYTDFDINSWRADTRHVAEYMDATQTDLSGLKDAGGKLLIYHNRSDALIPEQRTLQYYTDVLAGDPEAKDYTRLFMMPGTPHCFGESPAPNHVDWLLPIRAWVEEGKAPERVVAKLFDAEGNTTRTRPLCDYPRKAVYTGEGSTDSAENFQCQ